MAATFDPELGDPVSRIRLDLGDTDTAAALLQDETVTAVLALKGGDERLATIALAYSLISRAAQEPDKVDLADGEGQVTWGSRLKGWQALASRLQAEVDAAARAAAPGGAGVTRVRRRGDRDDECEYYAGGRQPW